MAEFRERNDTFIWTDNSNSNLPMTNVAWVTALLGPPGTGRHFSDSLGGSRGYSMGSGKRKKMGLEGRDQVSVSRDVAKRGLARAWPCGKEVKVLSLIQNLALTNEDQGENR